MSARVWVTFTRRTNEPKLVWLERQLDLKGIPHKRQGHSFHAPVLGVPDTCLVAAWDILMAVDDVPDDDPRFVGGYLPG